MSVGNYQSSPDACKNLLTGKWGERGLPVLIESLLSSLLAGSENKSDGSVLEKKLFAG